MTGPTMFSARTVKRVQQLQRRRSDSSRQTFSASPRVSNGPQILPVPSISASNSGDRNAPPTTQYRVVLIVFPFVCCGQCYAAADPSGRRNCAFSVDPDSAVVEVLPLLIVRLIRSKYPVPTS